MLLTCILYIFIKRFKSDCCFDKSANFRWSFKILGRYLDVILQMDIVFLPYLSLLTASFVSLTESYLSPKADFKASATSNFLIWLLCNIFEVTILAYII